jgi:antitoxin component of MazEF toxin-antitoxin module
MISGGDTVEVCVRDGEIVIRAAQPVYSLRELVGKITPGNRHAEKGWGKPSGREQW